MNLRPSNEDEFFAVREQVMGDFAHWIARQPDSRDLEADVVDLLFNGRIHFEERPHLGVWTRRLLDDILLDWIPRKTILNGEYRSVLPASVIAFLEYLDETGQLANRSEPVSVLRRHVTRLAPDLEDPIDDPDAWSPSRQLFEAMMRDGVDPDDEPALLAWIDDYNERVRREGASAGVRIPEIDGPGPSPLLTGERVRSPGPSRLDTTLLFSVPPDLPALRLEHVSSLQTLASISPLFHRVRRLWEWVGQSRPITPAGNLKVADGKQLVEMLDTDDIIEPLEFGHPTNIRSSTQLPDVDWVFRVAIEAGVVTTTKTRVQAPIDVDWDNALAMHRRLLDGVLTIGPLGHLYSHQPPPIMGQVPDQLDMSVVLLLALLHKRGRPLPIDHLVELATADHYPHLDGFDTVTLDLFGRFLDSDVRRLLRRLDEAGLVEVADVKVVTNRWGYDEPSGGTVTLAPLGAWFLAETAVTEGLELEVDRGPSIDRVRHMEMALEDDLSQLGPGGMVDVLATLLDVRGPDELIEVVDSLGIDEAAVAEVPEHLWRVEDSRVERLLETIAKFHPSKLVSKAARKALYKRRSAG